MICAACRAGINAWIDANPLKVMPSRGFAFGSGTAYDSSIAGVSERRRARHEDFRRLQQESITRIRESCTHLFGTGS